VQRVLDIDLDFFVEDVANWRSYEAERLDGAEFPPGDVSRALAFLRGQCSLAERLPGIVVDRHAELFDRWKEAIAAELLIPPLAITHVDAHADLGTGDIGFIHLLGELLFLPPEDRISPARGEDGLDDGNWLSYAVACHWIGDLTYVYNRLGPDPQDVFPYVMAGFDPAASNIELPAIDSSDLADLYMSMDRERVVRFREPKVPFRTVPWQEYRSDGPFDFVCLTRSPAFTPAESDVLFDQIRTLFIEEIRT
jgi:hypothetical protein